MDGPNVDIGSESGWYDVVNVLNDTEGVRDQGEMHGDVVQVAVSPGGGHVLPPVVTEVNRVETVSELIREAGVPDGLLMGGWSELRGLFPGRLGFGG